MVNSTKHQLHQHCLHYVSAQLHTVREALERLQLSAHEETKSSMGDKYETSKAMMQLEMEKLSGQRENIQRQQQVLHRIDPAASSATVTLGSVVMTDHGNFYLAISAGQLEVDGEVYTALSPASPLGSKLTGRSTGDRVEMNKQTYTILKVY